VKNIFKPKTRAYLYSVVGASVPLLVTIGLLTGEVAGHVLTIAAALLAVGGSALAYSNTDKD
jgi:hypothetical protein